jgi:hypothetical protein
MIIFRDPPESKICRRCGVEFYRERKHYASIWPKTFFCSRSCAHKKDHKPLTRADIERRVTPEPNSGCWLWLGSSNKFSGKHTPRAIVWWNGKHQNAARVAWMIYKSEIPAGMHVCHKCDNPMCVNPDHLFLGTARDNVLDMFSKGRAPRKRGEESAVSKLTEGAVKAILTDPRTNAELAIIYGVTRTAIWAVRERKVWRHVDAS